MASLSASEIQSQLTSLKEAARARSPGELGRVDQVGVFLAMIVILGLFYLGFF